MFPTADSPWINPKKNSLEGIVRTRTYGKKIKNKQNGGVKKILIYENLGRFDLPKFDFCTGQSTGDHCIENYIQHTQKDLIVIGLFVSE